MSKVEVLLIFEQADRFLTPDQVHLFLQKSLDRRSLYSYLLRLFRQGLLERNRVRLGSLAYRLTERGKQRIKYLQAH